MTREADDEARAQPSTANVLQVCDTCAVLVTDLAKHEAWHGSGLARELDEWSRAGAAAFRPRSA
jgi:hypothetical protein